MIAETVLYPDAAHALLIRYSGFNEAAIHMIAETSALSPMVPPTGETSFNEAAII